MPNADYLKDLEACELCEHRCGVNRLKGETGVCRMTMPTIASATLHPAPPKSYTVFMAGCNFKCLNCQNWTISQYPDNGYQQRGYVSPESLARECVNMLMSPAGALMGADRIFFSGGEATIHLPYIEEVVKEARKIKENTKVNFDTNGYLTERSLERVLGFTTSVTYDIKAYSNEVHLALTGGYSEPVIRNAEHIGRHAKEKLWEYRILVIPEINEDEIEPITNFIADVDPALQVCFLAFRPNFVLEYHPGAGTRLMKKCVSMAKASGLKNAYWAGYTDIPGVVRGLESDVEETYASTGARLAGSYALSAGCQARLRECSECLSNQSCAVKQYIPGRVM
jgi:pyruvate formate lyase activating enzyme